MVEAGDAVAALIDVSALDVDAGEADTVGGAGLASDGALLADGSVDEEAGSTGAGVVEVESGSSGAGRALSRVGGVADGAVESSAGVALEGLGGVQVEAGETGACAVVGVVEETSTSIAGDAGGRGEDDIETSGGRAGRGAATGGGVIGLGVLGNDEVSVEVLVKKKVSGIGNGDDDIGDSGLNVESFHNLADQIRGNGHGSINILVKDETIHSEFYSVIYTDVHTYSRSSCSDGLDYVSIAELNFDGGTNSQVSEGNLSTEENGVVVSVFSSVVLEEEDVTETSGS